MAQFYNDWWLQKWTEKDRFLASLEFQRKQFKTSNQMKPIFACESVHSVHIASPTIVK